MFLVSGRDSRVERSLSERIEVCSTAIKVIVTCPFYTENGSLHNHTTTPS